MDRAKVDLIAELKATGHERVADCLFAVLDERDNQVSKISERVDENHNRYETLSMALNHFTDLQMEHYKELKDAFPEEDCRGHREYHIKLVKAAEAQEDFYKSMRNELLKKGVWFGVILLFGLLAVGLQIKIKEWLGL